MINVTGIDPNSGTPLDDNGLTEKAIAAPVASNSPRRRLPGGVE